MAQVIKNSSIKNNRHLFRKKKKEIYLFIHCISRSLLDYLSLKSHSGGVIPNPIKMLLCWMRISILFDSACFPKSVVLFSWFQLTISALVCFKFRLPVCFSKGKVLSSRFVRKIVPFVSIPLFNSIADYQQNKNLRISAQIHTCMCNLVCVTVSTPS